MRVFKAGPLVATVLAVLLVIPVISSPPVAANEMSRTGSHEILVIPIQFPAQEGPVSPGDVVFCPDTTLACPSPLQYDFPSKSAADLQTMLDTQVSPYFSRESYGQVNVHYKVLANPDTLVPTGAIRSGWWPAPLPNQCFVVPRSNCLVVLAKTPANILTNYVIQTLCNKNYVSLHCGSGPNDFPRKYEGVAIINNWAPGDGQGPGAGWDGENMGSTTWVTSGMGFQGPVYHPTLGWTPAVMMLSTEGYMTQRLPQAMLHETGHFLGTLSHYGDCTKWLPIVQGALPWPGWSDSCLGAWSIMGLTDVSINEISGYEKLAFGWLWPGNQAGWTAPVYHNLLTEGAFVDSKTILPIEAPTVGWANLIRLDRNFHNIGSPLPINFLNEYDVECRAPGGSNPLMTPAVGKNGLLINNVHEISMAITNGKKHPNRAPAHSMLPALSNASISNAMAPGEIWLDPVYDLTVFFHGWTWLQDAGHWGCQLSVLHGNPGPPPAPMPSQPYFGAISRIPAGLVQGSGAVGLAPDIGINGLAGSVAPLWRNHPNLVFARVNSANDVTPSGQISVETSDAMTDNCGGAPGATATGTLVGFGPTATASVSVPASIKQTSLMTQVAFIPNDGSTPADGPTQTGQMVATAYAKPSAKSSVTFSVALGASCPRASTFYFDPPQGTSWGIKVTPRLVTLQPGSSAQIKVTIKAPPVGATGAPPVSEDLPILVHNIMFPEGTLPCDSALFFACTQGHDWPLGTMHVLARPNLGLAHAALACPTSLHVGGSGSLEVTSDQTDGSAMFEVNDGTGEQPILGSAAAGPGTWSTNLTPDHVGTWRVRARWNGDATHAPAQTNRCSIKVVP